MDPSKAHHQAIMANQILENAMDCPKQQQERRLRPQPEQALNCPRCDSTNTKFCYYNNYSLSQPRYFCKACRRYWTKGGTLRNVPVGGGCRKNNKRSSSSKRAQEQPLITTNSNPVSSLPLLTYDSNDLTLAFARLQKQSSGQLGFDDHDNSILGNPNSTTYTTHGFLDTLNGFQNYYDYGLGNGNIVESIGGSEEVLLPYNETGVTKTTSPLTTTTKHEFFSGRDGENKVLWGYPWQINEDGNMGGVDSGREYWNGHGASWYGILNSPLM